MRWQITRIMVKKRQIWHTQYNLRSLHFSPETIMNRDQLQNDYIETIIDGMDHKDMWQFVYDTMEQNFETYSDEELATEVKEYYPHLMDD